MLYLQGTKCQVLKEQGAKFCEETTLHGFQYLRTPGIVWKVLWGVAVFIVVCASVGFLGSNWAEYLNVSFHKNPMQLFHLVVIGRHSDLH